VKVKVRVGDDKKVCILVIMEVAEEGSKEIGLEKGYRESTEGWLTLM
jgi:transposase-like protein